jgi:hypothetical protein
MTLLKFSEDPWGDSGFGHQEKAGEIWILTGRQQVGRNDG